MTKVRDPDTLEYALQEVLGRLKDAGPQATGRSAAYLGALHDPAKTDCTLNVVDLRALDLAHRAAFGGSFPLYEALGRMLASDAAEQFADQAAIGATTTVIAREAGEAVAAMVAALQPGADEAVIAEALRQLVDLDTAADHAIPVLRAVLDRMRAIKRHEARAQPQPP